MLCCSMASQSQQLLTLEDAITATLKNNFDIRLARTDSASYAIDEQYAWAAFLPRLNGSASILFNNNNQKQKLADGTERKASGVRSSNEVASLNLNWTLFDGLRMFATRQKVSEYVKLGDLAIKEQVSNAVANVITTYYNIVRQKQQLKAIEEQMALNEERVRLAEKKFGVGLGAKPELLQARVDLNAQKATRMQELTAIQQLKEDLNLLLAFAHGSRYEVTDSIPINRDLVVGDIYSQAEKNNPRLNLALQNIRIADLTLKEARADRYPTVSFNSAYNFSKVDNQTVVNNFTPLFNRNQGFNYGLSASIPIFNNYGVRRQIRQAELNVSLNRLQLDYQRANVAAGITNAFQTYDLQLRVLELEEENIALAKENVTIAQERFRLGITGNLELREAQKSLEDAYNRLIAARYNTKVAETELLRLRGDLVKPTGE